MSKKPFHVMLTAEQRAALEAIRSRMGLRSEADVVRALIAQAADADQFIAEREASIKAGARGIRRGPKP